MKVSAFSASPRRGGNSDTLVDRVMEGAAALLGLHLVDVITASCDRPREVLNQPAVVDAAFRLGRRLVSG